MTSHEPYSSELILYWFEELSRERVERLQEHLRHCRDCRRELESLEAMRERLGPEQVPSAELLAEARAQLRGALLASREMKRPGPIESLLERARRTLAGHRVVLAAAASLLVGLLLGRQLATLTPPQGVETVQALDEVGITDLHFLDPYSEDGVLEVAYDAFQPRRLKAPLEDPSMQALLRKALLQGPNPAVRMRVLSALEESRKAALDEAFKQALIQTVTLDENDGVRRRALLVLQRMTFDPEVRSALIHVLSYDPNPGLRVAAIHALESIASGIRLEQELVEQLERRVRQEDNDFVRRRSQAFLQEVRNDDE